MKKVFTKTKKRNWFAALLGVVITCIVTVGAWMALKEPMNTEATEDTKTYMYMQTAELPFLESASFRESSGNGRIYGNGTLIEAMAKPTMTVWHFPKAAEVSLNTIVRKNVGNNGTAKLTFRIVHEHAASGLNEVVYPKDGGWFDLNAVEKNANGTSHIDTLIEGYVNVMPGDKLRMIVNNTNNGSWCTAYLTGGIKFIYDGGPASGISLYNNSSSIDYAHKAEGSEVLPENLQAFYGEEATKADAITYEYITSYTDYTMGASVEDNFFTYYDKALVKSSLSSVTGSFSGKKQLTNWMNGERSNLKGAKYIAYDVENTLGGFVNVGLEILTNASGNSGYGGVWTAGEYLDAYLIDATGTVTRTKLLATDYHNNGAVQIPNDFSGTVVFPVASLERVAYRFGTELNGYNSYDTITLDKIYRFDNIAYSVSGQTYSADGQLKFTNLKVYGNNLSDVELSENRAIQAIKDIGTVNVGSENLILFARETYNALNDTQKAKVFNYDVLTAAEEIFAEFTDYGTYIGTNGKDFSQTEGVRLDEPFSDSPSTISAWIKVDKDIEDTKHIGTIAGNMYKADDGSGNTQGIYDSYNSFSMEITTNGNPYFTWRISKTKKVVFVVDNVDVRTGDWLNLSFVRNAANNEISCYVNGILAQTKNVKDGELADITMDRAMMIGSDLTDDFVLSVGENPVFDGSIANVAVSSEVLKEVSITAMIKGEQEPAGLLCNVDFRSGEEGSYQNGVGTDVTDAFAWKEVSDDYFKAEDGEFTVAVFGDTQMMFSKAKDAEGNNFYAENYDETSNVFYKNVQWLIKNKDLLNLQHVVHVGDITDNLNNSGASTNGVKELQAGLRWMKQLSDNGVPWSVCRGNHDGGFSSTYQAMFDNNYSFETYGSIATDTYNKTDMRNAYYNFEVYGQKYMIVVLDVQPSDAEIAWANEIIAENPDRRVIITTHVYMGATGKLITTPMTGDANHLNTGDVIWEKLASQHKNVCMVICGHSSATDIIKRKDTGVNGNTVWQFMIDQSQMEYYGSKQTGVFALLNFADGGDTVSFNYYSASEGKLFRSMNQFTISLNGDEYIDPATSGVTSKNGLAAVELPKITEFKATDGVTGNYGSIYPLEDFKSNESMAMHSNNFCMKDQTYVYAVGFDVPKDGVFEFSEDSYILTEPNSWFYASVYVVDSKTREAKRWFPKGDSNLVSPSTGTQGEIKLGSYGYEYFLGGKSQSYKLSNIGRIRVNEGDKIILTFRSYNTNWVKVAGKITEDNGTFTTYNDIQYIMNTASSTSSTSLQNTRNAGWGEVNEDGTPKNYKGWTVGWFKTSSSDSYTPYKYLLTVQDTDGNTISSRTTTIQTTLPKLNRTGKVFVGYDIDGVLYPAGYTLNLTGNKTIKAVFVDFTTFNSGSVRMKNPTGLRFSTQLNDADYTYLKSLGLELKFGSYIAMASSITTDGKLDYSLLNAEATFTKLNVKSTVQVTAKNGYMQYNSVVVGLAEDLYNEKFVGRGYMIVTYADGSTQTLYATVNDNARSVAQVAAKAVADISKIKTKEYPYVVVGGYSPYSETNLSVLNGFASYFTEK